MSRKLTIEPDEATNVPCNGCTACCQHDALRLRPDMGDDLSQYEHEPHDTWPDQRMLAHKPDGSCIYLTPTGCGIHERRPYMCRTMDCRLLPLRMSFDQAKRMDPRMLPVWRQGKRLLIKLNKERGK